MHKRDKIIEIVVGHNVAPHVRLTLKQVDTSGSVGGEEIPEPIIARLDECLDGRAAFTGIAFCELSDQRPKRRMIICHTDEGEKEAKQPAEKFGGFHEK